MHRTGGGPRRGPATGLRDVLRDFQQDARLQFGPDRGGQGFVVDRLASPRQAAAGHLDNDGAVMGVGRLGSGDFVASGHNEPAVAEGEEAEGAVQECVGAGDGPLALDEQPAVDSIPGAGQVGGEPDAVGGVPGHVSGDFVGPAGLVGPEPPGDLALLADDQLQAAGGLAVAEQAEPSRRSRPAGRHVRRRTRAGLGRRQGRASQGEQRRRRDGRQLRVALGPGPVENRRSPPCPSGTTWPESRSRRKPVEERQVPAPGDPLGRRAGLEGLESLDHEDRHRLAPAPGGFRRAGATRRRA